MYQTIDEVVSVAGVYSPGRFTPKKFRWRGKVLTVTTITSVHDVKDGTVQKRQFAVLADNVLYLLEFNRTLESWRLLQVWVEA